MNEIIRKYLTDRGWTLPSDKWYTRVKEYLAWYQNFVEGFHKYSVFNGLKKVPIERHRLGMAKTCCEDHANLLLNEKVQITAEAFPALDDVLEANNFRERANRLLEVAFALGTGALVEYKDADDQPRIDYIRADMIYPLSWDNLVIKECAFCSCKIVDKQERYYIQIHTLDGGQYVIENVYLDQLGTTIPAPDGVEPVVKTGSREPLFQIIKPNVVNNLELDNPMGISVYGNALSQLKALDIVFDRYVNEFDLGGMRVLVPMSMATIEMQKNGTVEPVFDTNDTVFHVFETQAEGAKIETVAPQLRADQFDLGMQKMLDLFSKKVGLGNGYYRFDGGQVKTATEVISAQSDLYKNRQKNEIPLRAALTAMVRALSFLSGGSSDIEVEINFDDSIIEDQNAITQKNILLITNGLRSKVDAIMEIEKCSREEAEAKLAAIQQESSIAMPDVEAFAASEGTGEIDGSTAPAGEVVDKAEDITGKSLNGAQTQSLIMAIQQYQNRAITEGQAINIIAAAIGVSKDEAARLLRGEA